MKTLKLTALAAATISGLAFSAPAHAQAGTEYIGQVSAFGFNFCPRGWASAAGQLLPISQNTALFAVIGTTYGGDGRTTLALPDLRGRRPISQGTLLGGQTYSLGQKGGAESISLQVPNLPSHTHTGTVRSSRDVADTNRAARNSHATVAAGTNIYYDMGDTTNLMAPNTLAIDAAGGSVPITKVSPFETINWCIALFGIFPPRS